MKTIGYQVLIQKDNGDYNEWARIRTVESPIYTTKEAAEKALRLIKWRMLGEKKAKMQDYIQFQLECEYRHQRDINEFLGRCQLGLMREYKEVLDFIHEATILELQAYDTPTSSYSEYELA